MSKSTHQKRLHSGPRKSPRPAFATCALLAATTLNSCGPTPYAQQSTNQAMMQQAAQDARVRWADFMQYRNAPKPDWSYQVLAHIPVPGSPGETEPLWIAAQQIDEQAGTIEGVVLSQARKIAIQPDDTFTLRIDEIADWMVLDENARVIAGGFTMDVQGAEGHGKDWYGLNP